MKAGNTDVNSVSKPHSDSERSQLRSEKLCQTFRIEVFKPELPCGAVAQCPVVFATDANSTFETLKGISRSIQLSDTPPFILVGVGYPSDAPWAGAILRGREFSFPGFPPISRDPPPIEGVLFPEPAANDFFGAEGFHEFIAGDLIPHLEVAYGIVSDQRTYFGHSHGASFGLWLLLSGSTLFRNYVLSSPACSIHGTSSTGEIYDNYDFIAPYLSTFLTKESRHATKLYLSAGSEEEFERGISHYRIVSSLYRLAASLKFSQRDDTQLIFEILPNETHMSVWPTAFNRGLRTILSADTHS